MSRHRHATFHLNLCTRFWVILLTDRQTDRHGQKHVPPPLSEVNYSCVIVCCVLSRRVLVFGGNGFLGASSVERLLQRGHRVAIVNRGNWYWDTETRILPHVQAISCDRNNGVQSCQELVSLIDNVGQSVSTYYHYLPTSFSTDGMLFLYELVVKFSNATATATSPAAPGLPLVGYSPQTSIPDTATAPYITLHFLTWLSNN